ncbi:MAG: helix-turn-helix domain-containing protein [Alphaproteobacteria bacterium]|nr:helix-turn-helix domain-containing protein [Alphaproteobacteria bacterium]
MKNQFVSGDSALDRVRVRVLPDGRLTREDAATYLGVKPKTLAMWACMGKGPRVMKVGGRRFYAKADLDAFIETVGGPKAAVVTA